MIYIYIYIFVFVIIHDLFHDSISAWSTVILLVKAAFLCHMCCALIGPASQIRWETCTSGQWTSLCSHPPEMNNVSQRWTAKRAKSMTMNLLLGAAAHAPLPERPRWQSQATAGKTQHPGRGMRMLLSTPQHVNSFHQYSSITPWRDIAWHFLEVGCKRSSKVPRYCWLLQAFARKY